MSLRGTTDGSKGGATVPSTVKFRYNSRLQSAGA
jgi:hypothetical protein